MSVLLSPAALEARLAAGPPVHLLDVRWSLGEPDGRPAYRAGHIPGAVHVDLERELAAHGAPTDGRHPLPAIADLQRSARRWGLRSGESVVVYDASGGLAAARAWWLLGHAGVADVHILDGALDGWLAAGLPVATGDEPAPPPGDIVLAYGHRQVIDIDEAARFPAGGTLLDARAAARYLGAEEPVDPRAGHIPGARNAPASDNLDAAGRFLPPAELTARLAAAGVRADRPVAVYCGSGVTAAHTVAALAVTGREAALFPGSWSAWSNAPDRPVATGDAQDPSTSAKESR
ncbi:sulfurtransferase [Streptomyces profundus]|uniref:sulfurtransferase n=1 Tax=Streptomyces profundus TaxID=2867410 RepID=UPI001D169E2A|nr:sulfurtransferase [Streptomyces sp. MA3_2.13]UED86741.1 sulfurtransferase [Streptomyces sp. MA3_2.13]